MPIFQDDIPRAPATPDRSRSLNTAFVFPSPNDRDRRLSEESIRTELCDGPVNGSPGSRSHGNDVMDKDEDEDEDEGEDGGDHPQAISSRVELIARLKRGESPTWIPNRRLESMFLDLERPPSRKSNSDKSMSSPLLPSAEITDVPRPPSSRDSDTLRAGQEIERPRSALHSGDFTHESHARRTEPGTVHHEDLRQPDSPPTQSWLSTTPPRDYLPFQGHHRAPPHQPVPVPDYRSRSRAPSLSSSFSSSFLFKPPTSPLVQSLNHEDLDIASPINSLDISGNHRQAFLSTSLQSSPHSTSPLSRGPSFNRHNASPYQAHQPRKSLPNNQLFSHASPATPSIRSRRPSFASESSPLHHASMVGSYEESILRGRMSTTPSKPLDFVAQIGVLGRGKCKSNLRCPAHVTLPFPAVFYAYNSTSHGRSGTQDGPSPYVGQIDLENGLPSSEEKPEKRKRPSARKSTDVEALDISHDQSARMAQKQKRRSGSPKAPPGGSYRIPEKGQLQIIIKNPNKTAVKLFLIPYDLEGMEPGTKTFLRQRIYSAGPIIELPASSNTQSPRPNPANERPTLRYLIHVHICSPSRGRFYLYKNIRVVFANRVPDGKEHLINEIQLPEPRFSVYKPSRELSGILAHNSMAGAALAAEKAFRRRSSGFQFTSQRHHDAIDGVGRSAFSEMAGQRLTSTTPVDPIPFCLYQQTSSIGDIQMRGSMSSSSTDAQPLEIVSPQPSHTNIPKWPTSTFSTPTYDKLTKGDAGYGGNTYAAPRSGEAFVPEGLLARRLRGLDVSPEER